MIIGIVACALCLVSAVPLTHASVKLGELITPCSVKDPKLDECLLALGQKMLPIAVAGNKEWDVIPLNPLYIPFMQLQNSDGGSVGLSISMSNSTHYGRDIIQLKSITCDPKTLDFVIKTFIPNYVVLGTYDASGRILLLPLKGHGSANMTFIGVDVRYNFKTKLEDKGSKTYLKVTEFKTSFDVDRLALRFDNLFGNKQLSDTMNTFLNENSKQVFTDLKATTEELMTDIDRTILSRLLAKIPINQILKDLKKI